MSSLFSIFTGCSPAAKSNPPPLSTSAVSVPAKQAVASVLTTSTSLAALPAIVGQPSSIQGAPRAEGKLEGKAAIVSMSFAERDSYKDPSVKRMIAAQVKSLSCALHPPIYTENTKREYRLQANPAEVAAKMEKARQAAMADQIKLREKMLIARKDLQAFLRGFVADIGIIHQVLDQLNLKEVKALMPLPTEGLNLELDARNIFNICRNQRQIIGILDQILPLLNDQEQRTKDIILSAVDSFKTKLFPLSQASTWSGVIFESLKNILPLQDAVVSGAIIRYYDAGEVKAAISPATLSEVKVKTSETKYVDVKIEAGNGTTHSSAIATISPKNEDRHVTGGFFFEVKGKLIPVEVRAVFDGHGGTACATFASKNLIQTLKDKLTFYCKEGMDTVRIHQSLKEIFPDISRDFIKAHPEDNSGCTANACLYFPEDKTLYIVNAGDSCAILVKESGEVLKLSKDEKAADPILQKEIIRRGGRVENIGGAMRIVKRLGEEIFGLIGGRSLGDAHFEEEVSARGAIVCYEGIQANDVVVLCTDGVTDAADTLLIGSHVYTWMQEPGINMQKIAGRIAASADFGGSKDDITVISTQFSPVHYVEFSSLSTSSSSTTL